MRTRGGGVQFQQSAPPSARDVTALGLRLRDALLGWIAGEEIEGVAWVERRE
ncbi:MAG: hypothetical protein H6739_25115 [Alphaproteobacteria bacterium]|nr:hypothetical protein [Alphaproteobacteria bacterium]